MPEAYLDIETTGLSPYRDEITVVGIGSGGQEDFTVVQLFEERLTGQDLLDALEGVSMIFTYNGGRFDLPFIREYLKVNLVEKFEHHDLMLDCWSRDLYGGMKAVERKLGIPRRLTEVDGYEAVLLWNRYKYHQDLEALDTLLEYNREDVANLRLLKDKLA